MKGISILCVIVFAGALCGMPAAAVSQRTSFKAPPVYALGPWAAHGDSLWAGYVMRDISDRVVQGTAPPGTGGLSPGKDRDSILLRKIDSLQVLVADGRIRQTDSTMLWQISAMRRELSGIRVYLREQQWRARYAQLDEQEDSIKARKMHLLSAYPVSKRDYQQLHIYELQLDSLRNERGKLLPQDSNAFVGGRMTERDTDYTSQQHIDTAGVISGRADAYRKNIDTLRVATRVDSQYKEGGAVPDTLVNMLNVQLRQNRDSLVLLQRQYQAALDSAGYYQSRSIRPSQQTADTVEKKKSWFKRMFTHPDAENPDRKRTSSADERYYEQREKEYNDRSAYLQSQIDDLQRNDSRLRRDYDRALADESDRRQRVTVIPQPATVYPVNINPGAGGDGEDIRAMRQELADLRKELNDRNATRDGGNLPKERFTRDIGQQEAQSTDSTHLDSMKRQIRHLRQQVDSLRTAMLAREDTTKMPPSPDLSDYPVTALYFRPNSVTLEEIQIDKLAPVVAVAGKSKNIHITLKASTDGVGNREANKMVALRRTEYVRSLLNQRFGIAKERMLSQEPVIQAHGAVRKANALDRKVDVGLTY